MQSFWVISECERHIQNISQVIGTSVSLQNSEKVQYPSVTVCLNHEVAIFNGEALLDGLDESDNPKLFNMTHTTDMSDVLLSVRQNYGPITNMSCTYITPNISSFFVSQCAEEESATFRRSNKIFAYTHNALDASPLEDSFNVRIPHWISWMTSNS